MDFSMQKKLYRSKKDRKISGICGGIAEYLAVDSTIVRLIAVALAFLIFPATIVAYIVCIFVIPEDNGYIETDFTEKK